MYTVHKYFIALPYIVETEFREIINLSLHCNCCYKTT